MLFMVRSDIVILLVKCQYFYIKRDIDSSKARNFDIFYERYFINKNNGNRKFPGREMRGPI